MKELDEIRARLEAAKSHAAPAFMIPTVDVARLLAALDGIDAHAELAEMLCEMNGTEQRLASVPVVQIRAAITAALTPIPAVPSGAVGARGAESNSRTDVSE